MDNVDLVREHLYKKYKKHGCNYLFRTKIIAKEMKRSSTYIAFRIRELVKEGSVEKASTSHKYSVWKTCF